ncbi:hypothetical protein B6V73_03325 [Thioclava sp. JM3]|uniref:tetratricopeptide repeat protein n=1 Tax=Thioclava sp. JM3 TaxID=1973004 RepID=UPI000B545E8E|nr:tetratricopeptide repeat protein [Thioclava sp. JM3]OWY17663.1 hypothetical protein B6V73_03325 [Thioclava sp. JM3]
MKPAFAHFSLGQLNTRSFAPDPEQAILHCNEAIRLDPNYLDAFPYRFLITTYGQMAISMRPSGWRWNTSL